MKRRTLLTAALGAAAASAQQSRPDGDGERLALLARGEAALAALDPAQALAAFEQAARISHSADTEMAIVRASMQAGEYRRALTFGAHTAGAHLDETGGTALYAWLLHAGAQQIVAGRLLAQALERSPGDPLLAAVANRFRAAWPIAGVLMRPPARLAPYGESTGLPSGASVVASATLAGGGNFALVPSPALVRGASYWVRNGLGRLVPARPDAARSVHGVSRLRLEAPLAGPGLVAAPAAPFPGSIAYAVEYPPQRDPAPAWPQMKAGFVGAASKDGATRELGIELPKGSRRGGAVLDAAGRLIGVAVGTASRADALVPALLLRQAFGAALFPVAAAGAARPIAPDEIYELALSQTLQLVRSGPARATGAKLPVP